MEAAFPEAKGLAQGYLERLWQSRNLNPQGQGAVFTPLGCGSYILQSRRDG